MILILNFYIENDDPNEDTKLSFENNFNDKLAIIKNMPVKTESSTNALNILMDHKNANNFNDFMDELDTIENCRGCFKKIKLYDVYNDDYDMLVMENPGIELVDMNNAGEEYLCNRCEMVKNGYGKLFQGDRRDVYQEI